MAVSGLSVTKIAGGSWRWTWTAGTTPYRVVWRGMQVAAGLTTEQWEWYGSDLLEPPAIEVLDAADGEALTEAIPPYLTLQWRGHDNAAAYRVERYVSSAWTTVGQVTESGQGYYRWPTPDLVDGETPIYRVIAVDLLGNESTAVQYTGTLICYPEPPVINMTYSGGTLTVSARA